ncbi:MAG: hydantoinase B/oxoprolinase family protein [Solirubrobacteraceae bacterium]
MFPPPGSLITPEFPAPVGMRFFVIARSLGIRRLHLAKATGGAMPATTRNRSASGACTATTTAGASSCFARFWAGSGGRWYADGSDVVHIDNSRNLPVEFSEARYPVVVESLALRTDSGGAGEMRGGLGYRKRIRASCRTSSCCPTRTGRRCGRTAARRTRRRPLRDRASRPAYKEDLPGLADDVPVPTGSVVEIVTTGGGG